MHMYSNCILIIQLNTLQWRIALGTAVPKGALLKREQHVLAGICSHVTEMGRVAGADRKIMWYLLFKKRHNIFQTEGALSQRYATDTVPVSVPLHSLDGVHAV